MLNAPSSVCYGWCRPQPAPIACVLQALHVSCKRRAVSCKHAHLLPRFLQAFEKSGVKLDAPAETIAEVLKYHVVKGDKNIPAGFTDGAAVPTLQGQDITVTFVE